MILIIIEPLFSLKEKIIGILLDMVGIISISFLIKIEITRLNSQSVNIINTILLNNQQIDSFFELAKLFDIKQLTEIRKDKFNDNTDAFVLSQFQVAAVIIHDYNTTINQNTRYEKLLKLTFLFQKLKNHPLTQGIWYRNNIQRSVEKWLSLIENELNSTQSQGFYRSLANPFIYGNPISLNNAEIFVGRNDVVEIIKEMLMKTPKPTLFLYGRRRTGKTSALLNLNRFLEHLAVAVLINLQDSRFRESSSAFCYNLSKEISQYLPTLKDAHGRVNFQQNPFTVLDEFLDAAERFVTETKRVMLLAFDEYERLDASHKDILDTIRAIIQHRRNIVVLVAGSRRFSEIKGVNWADYLINTQTVEISYLDRASAYKLITNPIEGFDLVYADNMPEAILESTHCQPYLLQAIGSELVNYLNFKQRKAATFADLEIVKRNVLTAAEAYFTNVWFDECNDSERAFLEQLILNEQDAVPFDPRHEPTRSLLRKETLERRNDHVYIAVPLFRQWIREKHLMMTS